MAQGTDRLHVLQAVSGLSGRKLPDKQRIALMEGKPFPKGLKALPSLETMHPSQVSL